MEQSETVLLFLMEGGAVMASEGSVDSFWNSVDGHGKTWYKAIHPITFQVFVINMEKIVSVQEVPRESVRMGPNKIEVPGGRIN